MEETKKPKQLGLFDKKASLSKLGFMKQPFFSHTTTKSALSSILSSGKIRTGKSLGEARKGLRNIDDMTPDELGEYVSTSKNKIYADGKRFRAILMREPKNKASHLRRESLFKGDVPLNPADIQVAVPADRLSSYQKSHPTYKFVSSESVNPSRLTKYKTKN